MNSTTGSDREISCSSAPSSRFMRSCDAAGCDVRISPDNAASTVVDSPIDGVAICTYQVGATALITIASDGPS